MSTNKKGSHNSIEPFRGVIYRLRITSRPQSGLNIHLSLFSRQQQAACFDTAAQSRQSRIYKHESRTRPTIPLVLRFTAEMPATLKEFETVFPKLVEDLKEHCQKYNLPQTALTWFEEVWLSTSPMVPLEASID